MGTGSAGARGSLCGELARDGRSRVVTSARRVTAPGSSSAEHSRRTVPDQGTPGAPGSCRYQEVRRHVVPIVNAGVRALLKRERELIDPGFACQLGDIAGGLGDDVGGLGRRGEQAAFDSDISDACCTFATDQPGGERHGDAGGRLGTAPVYPEAGVNTSHAIQEQHRARQPGS